MGLQLEMADITCGGGGGGAVSLCLLDVVNVFARTYVGSVHIPMTATSRHGDMVTCPSGTDT